MLPEWNPDRISQRIPGVNIALVGGRRMGKSTATADLLWRFADQFDLVLCFVGSAHCNPVLEALLERYWDPRFFFSEWNPAMIRKLLQQQEKLIEKRSILILVDDVVLSSKAQDQLCTLAMRGRHFGISLMMACVSYTTLPKRVRRSLDVVLVFSLPMKGDLKVLTWEYTTNTRVAEFALKRLEEHQCLVLETLTRKQRLAVWKATLSSCEEIENKASRPPVSRKKLVFSGRHVGDPLAYRQSGNSDFSESIRYGVDSERAGVRNEDAGDAPSRGNDLQDRE